MKHLKRILEMEVKSLPTLSHIEEVNNYLLDLKDLGCHCKAKEFFMEPWKGIKNPNGEFKHVFNYTNPENYFNSNNLNAVRTCIVYVSYKFSNLEINSEIAQEVVILKNRLSDKFGSEIICDYDVDNIGDEGFEFVYRICVRTNDTLRSNKNILEK